MQESRKSLGEFIWKDSIWITCVHHTITKEVFDLFLIVPDAYNTEKSTLQFSPS